MTDPDKSGTVTPGKLELGDLAGRARQGVRIGLGIAGASALVLGILLTFFPGESLAAIAILFGIYFLITGVVYIAIGALASGVSGSTRAINVILGILLVIVGIVALRNIGLTLLVIVLMVGIGWIVEGILAIAVSGRRSSRGWSITYGVISILAGIVIVFLPGISLVTLALVGGISLLVIGVAQIIRAITLGSGPKK